MSDRPKYPIPVHYLAREEGQLGRIACNASVHSPKQYTSDVAKVSCHKCAKNAPGLTVEQRVEIWQLADQRLEKFSKCPWSVPSGAKTA